MKLKLSYVYKVGVFAFIIGAKSAYALTTLVTFDPASDLNAIVTPPTPLQTTTPASNPADPFKQGPSYYINAPAATLNSNGVLDGTQTITTGGATFSGGVILGLASNFPAIQFASGVNVYGTADFGNSLSNTLSITTDVPTTEVSFALFNGETFTQTYTIQAFDSNKNLLGSQTISNIAPNWQSGFGLVDLLFPSISSVTINATNSGSVVTSVFDFLIDDVAFGTSVTAATNLPAPTPNLPVVNPPPNTTPVVNQPNLYIPNSVIVDSSKSSQSIYTVVNNGDPSQGKSTIKIKNGEVEATDDKGNVTLSPLTFNFAPLVTNSTVLPVPEPENYAMILTGLGIMAIVARRRRTLK